MKERFEIYDGSAEAKKAKGKSKNLSGFHPLFTASARRSIALDSLKIWLLLGFIVGVVTGVATGAGAVSVLLGLLIAAVIYFGFRDDTQRQVLWYRYQDCSFVRLSGQLERYTTNAYQNNRRHTDIERAEYHH